MKMAHWRSRLVRLGAIVCALLALASPTLSGIDTCWSGIFPAAHAADDLPLPRFASLQSSKVNMRAGPGESYPILWTYQRANLPVEIIEEFDIWRRIRDHDGVVGWVKSTLLTGKRHALVRDQQRVLRAAAEPDAAPVAYVDPGVILRVHECSGAWCRLEVQGHEGWLMKSEFWGAYANETVND